MLYGLVHGTVLSVSHDAITRDRLPDKSTDLATVATTASSEPRSRELVYAARVSVTVRRCWSKTTPSTSPPAWP